MKVENIKKVVAHVINTSIAIIYELVFCKLDVSVVSNEEGDKVWKTELLFSILLNDASPVLSSIREII